MTVYLDLVFLLNFLLDLLLLISVAVVLKRRSSIRRFLFASLVGSCSILFLFLELNSIVLFLMKFVTANIMIFICFGYKNFRYMIINVLYLYINSIVLGGFLYFFNIELSYKSNGLTFYSNSLSFNFLILIFLSPIIIFLYIKTIKKLKENYSNYYKVIIYLKGGKIINLVGFVDTGNKLKDPYHNRPIILVDNKELKKYKNYLLVPYKTVNGSGILKCIVPLKVYIEGVGDKYNVLVGLSNEKILLDDVDCILNTKLF